MRGRFMRLLGALVVVGAMIAITTTPAAAQDFDEEAAAAEVVENLTLLFDSLATAGDPEADPADVEAALAAAASVVQGGDSAEVQAQIPGIAGLAAAAQLEVVIDVEPTFDESNTTATYTFSLLSFGNPSQVNESTGVHVLEDGVWKLSAELWGAFVALGGDAEPEDVGDGDTDTAGDDDELANTGVNSDNLMIWALALIAGGTMLSTTGRRRIRLTD